MPDLEPILSVRDLRRHYGGVRAVDGVSLDVARGSITALIGPNGAGKSTLFSLVSGFERPDSGEVHFNGSRIHHLPAHRIARLGLVRTFQLTKTFAALSVLENLMVSAVGHPGERLTVSLLRRRRVSEHEDRVRDRAVDVLEVLGLSSESSNYAGNLSGGQRKLLELGRALMLEPTAVLLDEPMAGVNRTLGKNLLQHVQSLRVNRGTTFVFVEHDMDVVMGHADTVVVMAEGKILMEGTPEAVRADARVLEAYLGMGATAQRSASGG